MKKIRMMMAAALAILASCSTTKSGESTANPLSSKVIVAYVTSWSNIVPEPQYMTHINYAFGHVNESFDGVRIDNEERLKQIVDLKKQNPVDFLFARFTCPLPEEAKSRIESTSVCRRMGEWTFQ